jgi:hypothetical protein
MNESYDAHAISARSSFRTWADGSLSRDASSIVDAQLVVVALSPPGLQATPNSAASAMNADRYGRRGGRGRTRSC